MADKQINVKINGTSAGAVQAIDRVGQKADEVLGKRLASLGEKMSRGLSIAGAAVGITAVAAATKEAVRAGTELSDKYALIKSRINLINDGTQSTAEIMDKVYAAAERTRGSYLDMAGAVGKLGILAKDAFSSNDETIAFVEQMNKQFKIGGASIQEQTSAMYQLTQAMAAGKLQGDVYKRQSKVRAMGEDIASANYQQEPIDVKGRLYTYFSTYKDIPRDDKGYPLFSAVKAYVDSADTGEDWLCAIVYGVYNDNAYILDILFTDAPMEITERKTAELLHRNGVNVSDIESNNGGRGFARNVKRILKDEYPGNRTKIVTFHQSKNKEARRCV